MDRSGFCLSASDMWTFLAWLVREVYYVFIEPILVSLDWVKLGLGDASYGRDSLPYSPIERENIYDNPAVKATRRRVFLSRGTPVLDLSLGSGKRALPFQHNGVRVDAWINYYVWEMPEAVRQKNLNADVYLVHGINEYSGRVIPQAMVHMKNGFRTIAIDMPTYGRSSGLHSHLPTLRMNEGALDAVMAHVRLCDENDQIPYLDKRIRVAQGGSMYVDLNLHTGAASVSYTMLPCTPPIRRLPLWLWTAWLSLRPCCSFRRKHVLQHGLRL